MNPPKKDLVITREREEKFIQSPFKGEGGYGI